MMDDMAAIFREELRDLLESLERGLLDLEAAPQDMALVNQVFRDLHTVKGSGAMFGFAELAGFIHSFETLFDKIRSGAAVVTSDIIHLSLEARDQIPGLVEGVPDPEGRRQAILEALEAQISAGVPVAFPAPAAVQDVSRLTFGLRGDAFAMGARPDIILDEFRALGATGITCDTSGVPPLDSLVPGACHLVWHLDLPAAVTDAQIEEVFIFADADWSLRRGDPPPTAAAEALALEPAATIVRETTAAPPAAAPRAGVESAAGAAAPQGGGATIRVPAERLDALMDSVGELVILEARLTELARESRDAALMATAEQITRLAARLRDSTMTMRMVPMRSLVARFRRLVLGLSDTLGKPISFNVLGEDTELDKTVIEKLADPIVHILRNSLDHGLETPEERLAAGKPAEGRVELSAEHAGAEVLIRIRDDGRGMNPDKLRTKAVAAGLIAPDAVLTEAQCFALIFEPGFSTAAAVTEISGRGVGMDVVRRTIDGLRGAISIESRLGEGTTVTLRLPLTLAIIDGLLIEVAGERYILPMAAVQEIVELPASKLVPNRAGDFLEIRGRFVPFLRLRQLFACDGQPEPDQNVVIVTLGDTRVGVVVDRIIGTNQTVIKQMSKLHANVRAVSGATILGDGTVALILDVMHLLALGQTLPDPSARAREVAA
nr:chemotaxis protein CheA [Paracoccus saliphilus]